MSRSPASLHRALKLVLLLGAALMAVSASAFEPRNLDVLKREIRAYVDSGEYERELARVVAKAMNWIEERAARAAREAGDQPKLAVVLDLDETLLSNLPEMKANDFGYIRESWIAWVDRGEAPAVEPVRALYRQARALGVEVIFLTGRTERDRAGTEKNLRAIGCDDYRELICRPDDSTESAAAYKTRERRQLVEEGWVIVANIGDQESDLSGGYAERGFKLPNPFYLTE